MKRLIEKILARFGYYKIVRPIIIYQDNFKLQKFINERLIEKGENLTFPYEEHKEYYYKKTMVDMTNGLFEHIRPIVEFEEDNLGSHIKIKCSIWIAIKN